MEEIEIEIEQLFLTEAVFCSDMNESDFMIEVDYMIARNKAIQEFYERLKRGRLTMEFLDEFGDILNHFWIDPYAWVDNTFQVLTMR